MNRQIGLDNEMSQIATEKLGVNHTEFIHYYAWPQMYGSTAGPFGGIGGQAMTTYTIEAYATNDKAAIFCNGRFLRVVEKFTPLMQIY